MNSLKNSERLGRIAVLGAAVLAAVSLTGAPDRAYAQNWRGDHWDRGDWGRRDWDGHNWRHHRHHRDGWSGGEAAALGLLGGALAGAAIASTANPYNYPSYSYPYTYSYPYSYSYSYPYSYGYGY